MKILHITPTFSPNIGGIENVIENLVRELLHRGIQTDVAQIAVGLKETCEERDGYRVWRVPMMGNRLVGIAPALRSITPHFDLLHVHDPQMLAVTASVKAFGCGKPAVLSTHGGFQHTNRYDLAKRIHERFLLQPMLSRYALIMATSKSDFDYFRNFTNKIVIAANGVDVSRFARLTRDGPPNMRRWIYWGRLSRNKRLDIVIDYVHRLRIRGEDVSLCLAGRDFDGLAPELLAQIGSLRLGDRIIMRLLPSDAELEALIMECGIFITASTHEGFGLSVVEAMAAGQTIICRNMPPFDQMISFPRNGLLLRFDRSEADFAAICSLLRSSPLEVAIRTEANAQTAMCHDWSNAILPFLEGYARVIGSRANAF